MEMQASIAKAIAKEYFGKLMPEVDKKIEEISFKTTTTSSHFDNDTKTVFINTNNVHDVNHFVHELFHAISTNYLSDRVHIGFNNKTFKKFDDNKLFETSYGYGINEGATHAFTRDATAGRFGEINPAPSYNFAANIYKNLEKYVGKSVMKILYTNSNARNFVSTVSKVFHTNEENVLKLVLTLDTYFDTYNIFRAFLSSFGADFESKADVSSLLANCYVYLSKIVSDKLVYENKEFNFKRDISLEELSKEEVERLNDAMKKYATVKILTNNSEITAKQYEKMAMKIIGQEYNKNLTTLDIPKEFKCSEFYNFLFLNNYICDENKLREDFLNSDLKAPLTQKQYSKKYDAYIEDETLPANIRTALSARYAIRANCVTSDYYMQKCLGDKMFDDFLKNSDEDYYNALLDLNNQNSEK